ncbi:MULTISPECIES: hypothetical protein [Photorhabdus]|uniref:hypothetical protein n=1 Tax=Photorhabdus TaxID=29487 RepID=UPI000B130CEA|nr:hypothetical protein [Photorhabdus luminescens]
MNEFIYSVKDRITIIAIVFSNSSLSFYNDTFVNKPVVTLFISSTGYFKHWLFQALAYRTANRR